MTGAVAMACVGVTLAALPASGQSGDGLLQGRLTLVPAGDAPHGGTWAAKVEHSRGGGWVPAAGEAVTFAFVGEGSMQVGDGAGGAQCTTDPDGECHATVWAAGEEPSLVLATSGDLSADVTIP